MTFFWPNLLWLLLIPAALLGWSLARRRHAGKAATHPKILRAEAGPHSLDLASAHAEDTDVSGPRIRGWLLIGLSLATVALARPQWGRIEEPVFDQSREILLAIDLSRSMLTPDVRPSRLDRAKLLIQSLLEKLQGERVGLVVFSGTAFLQSPLSADYEILREFLPALNPDFLPEGGTNYRALIDTAVDAFGTSAAADRFLIILSDGEATEDNWKERVDVLKQKGVRVLGLGVGTAAGGMIPDGSGGLVKDQRGAVVLSKLESATLQELAQATGGVYRDASTWVDLSGLINETVNAGRKGEFLEKNTIKRVERFQWPLALALWCLLVSAYYEFPVRPRVRDVVLKTGNRIPDTGKSKPSGSKPGVGAVAGIAMLLVLLSGIRYPVSGFAAAAIAPAPAATPSPETGAELGKIIGRVAAKDQPTAPDYAEMARETLRWGERVKEKQQRVPAGPVKDAIQAVDELIRMKSQLADWAKLRADLEKLLEEEPPQKQPPQQNQQQQQQQDQQKQEQQNQQQDSQSQPNQDQQKQEQKASDQKQEQQKSGQPQAQKQPDESAFGKMQDQQPPPPPPTNETQKVGGAERKKDETREAADPALALPLQKLDQLRNQDSPAQLFQLMERDRKPPQKPAKDW